MNRYFSKVGQQACEKMFNITNYQRNVNQNFNDLTMIRMAIIADNVTFEKNYTCKKLSIALYIINKLTNDLTMGQLNNAIQRIKIQKE